MSQAFANQKGEDDDENLKGRVKETKRVNSTEGGV